MLAERLISSELYVEGPTPARYWGDQWMRVAEKVLKGLNHAFTNRLTAVEATATLLTAEGKADSALGGALGAEVKRLHDLLQLYRCLTAETFAAPEPIRLQDMFAVVLRLHEHHSDLQRIVCTVRGDVDTEPVLVRYSALLRSLLVLLESVAGSTLRAGAGREVSVWFGNAGDEVMVRFSGAAPPDQLLFSGEGSLLNAVRASLAHAQGRVEGVIKRHGSAADLEYELRLPRLTQTQSQRQ
jgi:membrane carboxypeptidase/penicillin-binding protein PbpC